jgi:tetratricopeptide (TPR) repeat protein
MTHSSALDGIWDFDDLATTESKFREFLLTCESSDERAECMTQIARCLGLQRKFDEAHELLDQAAALMSSSSRAEVRYMLERGRVINSAGGRIASRQVFHQASEAAQIFGDDGLVADAMHMIAIVEDGEESLNWNLKTIEYCEASSEPKAQKWLASLYNNTGWSLFELKRLEEALSFFVKAQDLREKQGVVHEEQIADWCVARCLREMGRTEEAFEIQRLLLKVVGDQDEYVCEELAELYALSGDMKGAKIHARVAFEKLSLDPWFFENEKKRLERLKQLAEKSN